ncbi:MAG: site-specific integrase, partial [Patescibacteria group bacterium]
MNGLTLKDLLPKFIDSLKEKGRSPATILAYRTDLEQLTSLLVQNSKVSPTQVIGSDLETFRDTLLAQKYTPKSTSRKLNAVKTFFRYLKQQNFITSDPSELVSHPKIENSLPKFLTQIEYRALRDVSRSDSRIFAIIELVLQTGIRISEVASLKTKNLDGDSLTI